MRRYQRRQATRARLAEFKEDLKLWRHHAQVHRIIFSPDGDLYTQEEMQEMYGERLFVNPVGYIVIAQVSQPA
jgi:hypothetical protein